METSKPLTIFETSSDIITQTKEPRQIFIFPSSKEIRASNLDEQKTQKLDEKLPDHLLSYPCLTVIQERLN